MIQSLLPFDNFGLLILRVIFGLIFIVHGWPKLSNIKKTWVDFDAMGFKPGIFWGTIVAFLETIGGFLLILGLITQLMALLLAFQMIVATVWKLKNKARFVGGYELDIILIAIGIALAVLGPGDTSLDVYMNIIL